jgi:hypothetical protein
VEHGLKKLEQATWERFFVLADGWGAERQLRLVARMVEPIAPNLAALRRVSSNAERA